VLHAQFGLHEMMVLGLALRRTLGDTEVSQGGGRRALWRRRAQLPALEFKGTERREGAGQRRSAGAEASLGRRERE
jgi:hypothetical protein